MSSEDRFFQVLREFVALSGGQGEAVDSGTEVSFEFDGMLAFIFMHPAEDMAVIDVEILALQDPGASAVNRDRMLMLHQLNSITRFTHGATAFVSVDNMLMISRNIVLDGLTGMDLAERLGEMLDTAAELRATWNNLRDLIVKAGQAAQGQTAAEVFFPPGQFA
jgi:hypothetical protein